MSTFTVQYLSTPQALQEMKELNHDLRTVMVQIYVFSSLQQSRVVRSWPLAEIMRRLIHYPHERLDRLLEFQFDFHTQFVSFMPALNKWISNDIRLNKLLEHGKQMRTIMLKQRKKTFNQ